MEMYNVLCTTSSIPPNELEIRGWFKSPVIFYVINLRHARASIFLDLYES